MIKKSIGKTVLSSALAAALVVPCLPAIAFAGSGTQTPQSAPTIAFGTAYTDEINDSDETDYFRVVVPANGKLTVSFGKMYNEDVSKWQVKLLSEDLSRTVFDKTYSTANSKTEQAITGIKAGTYYLKVASGYYDGPKGRPYTIKASFTKSDSWEEELNDDPYEAKELTLSKKVEGTVINENDADWYKFTVPSKGYYSVGFGRKYSNTSEGWRVKILNHDQYEELFNDTFGNSKSSTTSIVRNLSKGTYYVRVSDYYGDKTGDVYSLKLTKFSAPKATKVKSLKGVDSGFTAKWKAVKGADGYRLQCSSDKGFSSVLSENTVDDASQTSVTFKSWLIVGSNQKLYFRIQSYKDTADQKIYSKWTKAKSVRTK